MSYRDDPGFYEWLQQDIDLLDGVPVFDQPAAIERMWAAWRACRIAMSEWLRAEARSSLAYVRGLSPPGTHDDDALRVHVARHVLQRSADAIERDARPRPEPDHQREDFVPNNWRLVSRLEPTPDPVTRLVRLVCEVKDAKLWAFGSQFMAMSNEWRAEVDEVLAELDAPRGPHAQGEHYGPMVGFPLDRMLAERLRDAAKQIGITDPREAEFLLAQKDGRDELVIRRRERP